MQNLVSMNLSESQLNAVDAALTELETQLAELSSLAVGAKKRLLPLGEKSEAFCRQTLRVLSKNPQVVPPNLDVSGAVRQMETRDQLRARTVRLSRLMSRIDDTDFMLGSDVMQVATQGYALLKVVGKSQGLDEVRKDLGVRFAKTRKAKEKIAA